MIGPAWLSWHATWSGKTAASRSSERMRWIGIGTRRPPSWRRSARARGAFPRQRVADKGGGERRLRRGLGQHLGAQHREHALERKAVLLAERDDDPVVGGGRLQLEVE